jgi:hypothetical protein
MIDNIKISLKKCYYRYFYKEKVFVNLLELRVFGNKQHKRENFVKT